MNIRIADPVTTTDGILVDAPDAHVFLTSDEHHGHDGARVKSNRPFTDVDHMTHELITRHNAVVPDHGMTIHLGDYSCAEWRMALEALKQMRGRHILIAGNHDKPAPQMPNAWKYQRLYLEAGFEAVLPQMQFRLPGARKAMAKRDVTLSHFPYRADHKDYMRYPAQRPVDMGGWVVHGHVHGLYKVRDRGVNVGVDVWDYTPVSARTVAQLIDDVEAGIRAED